jgi:hypothetical protein
MLTKTTFALVGALIFGSAPALAAQTHRHVPTTAQSWTTPALPRARFQRNLIRSTRSRSS